MPVHALSPQTMVDCNPEITKATTLEFEIRNKTKHGNFICGELVQGGQLSFIVENLPKDGTGCSGKWLFDSLMRHFISSVKAIQGNWTYGVNLNLVNHLTAGGMSVEESAKQTYTGNLAKAWGFVNLKVERLIGSPGFYSYVNVLFTS